MGTYFHMRSCWKEKNMKLISVALVLICLASYCTAQCMLDMKCESDDIEYNIGQSWTDKDCFSCSCSGTGKYETLLSCYETNERPDLGPVAGLVLVEYKNNFTTT